MSKKTNKPKDEKPDKPKGEIKDVNCYMKIRKNAFLIEWKETTYITNKDFVEQLINGELEKQNGEKAKAIKLGVIDDGEITNDDDKIFLTLKGKALYLSVDKQLLMVAVSSVRKLYDDDYDNIKMGLIK